MVKRAIVLAVLAVTITLAAVLIGNYLMSSQAAPPKTSTPVTEPPVETVFICQPQSSKPFNITIQADLTEGMDSTQAAQLAKKIFEHEMVNASCVLDSVSMDYDCSWLVSLSWGAIVNGHQEERSHYFDVEVNPVNQTATYTRCY